MGEVWICGNYKPDKIIKANIAAEVTQPETSKKRAKSGDLTLEDFMTAEQKASNKANKKKKNQMTLEEHLDELDIAKSQRDKKKKHKNHQKEFIQEQTAFREEHKSLNDKERSLPHRWLNFTHVFSQTAFGKSYLVESLSLGNKDFAAICTYKAPQKSAGLVNLYKKGDRFRGADEVIKKVAFK